MNATAAVVGVGSTALTRRTDRSIVELAVEAADAALADAGLTADDVDGCIGIPYSPNAGPQVDGVDLITAASLARHAGWSPRVSCDVMAMAGGAMVQAAALVAAKLCDRVVVVRAVTSSVQGFRPVADPMAWGAAQFTVPYGLMPGIGRHALAWQRYAHETGATRETLFEVVDAQRRYAASNPYAFWRDTPLTRDEYMAARWVCEPLCLFDCDMPVAGAVAMVVTNPDLAASHSSAAYLTVAGSGPRPELALHESRIELGDVQVAQLYDGFSPFVVQWLERLGFAPAGQAAAFIAAGGLEREGSIPTNTFGGSLSEGRLHGMGHLREAVLQAMGRAGDRQIVGVRHSLALVGTPEDAALLVFSPEPDK